MKARACLVGLAWTILVIIAPQASASESGDEQDLATITVMVTGKLVEDCATDPSRCTSGAGVILAIDRNGFPLVYTARHLAHVDGQGDEPMVFSVRLRDGEEVPAAVRWESDAKLDVLVLQLQRRPRRTADFTCRRIAVVSELTSQTELAAVGSPNWRWSRLNRFNRADDKFVYMETPADKQGFSGGPVFVRGTLELLGLYQQGAEGIVRVARLDALPEEAQPQALTGNPEGAVVFSAFVSERGRTLGCSTTSSRFLAGRDTTLRLGIGLAQMNSPIQQLASPLATLAIGGDASLARIAFLTLGFYASAQLGASYFDKGADDRTVYGQGFFNFGLRLGIGSGFVDALWAPGAYVLGDDLQYTARSLRLALGRRMGDGVAGLAAGYVSRPGEPGIATLELFSDFTVASAGGIDMPGIQPESTGDPRVDALLVRESSEKVLDLGAVVTTASDQPAGFGGVVGAVQVSPIQSPFGVRRSFATHLRETLELQFGSVRLRDQNHFYFAYAAEVGLRIRLGLPSSLLLDLFYYLPVVTHYDDRWRFPLVGAGGGIGYKLHGFAARAAYKYQITKAIYPSEPNLSFAGLSAQIDL
jgi:hypothetical protein